MRLGRFAETEKENDKERMYLSLRHMGSKDLVLRVHMSRHLPEGGTEADLGRSRLEPLHGKDFVDALAFLASS